MTGDAPNFGLTSLHPHLQQFFTAPGPRPPYYTTFTTSQESSGITTEVKFTSSAPAKDASAATFAARKHASGNKIRIKKHSFFVPSLGQQKGMELRSKIVDAEVRPGTDAPVRKITTATRRPHRRSLGEQGTKIWPCVLHCFAKNVCRFRVLCLNCCLGLLFASKREELLFPTCQVRVVSRIYVRPDHLLLLLLLVVLHRTSTTTIRAQCSLPDLNHDHPRPVLPARPQPRPSTPSVPCRTSTTTIHAQCSLLDLNHNHLRPVFPAGPQHTTTNRTTNAQAETHNHKHNHKCTIPNAQPQTQQQTHNQKHTTTSTQPQTQQYTHTTTITTRNTQSPTHNYKDNCKHISTNTTTHTTTNRTASTQSQTHNHKHRTTNTTTKRQSQTHNDKPQTHNHKHNNKRTTTNTQSQTHNHKHNNKHTTTNTTTNAQLQTQPETHNHKRATTKTITNT